MSIVVTDNKEPIYLTEEELRKYRSQYEDSYLLFSGAAPSFEEFVRKRKREEAEKNSADSMQELKGKLCGS